MDIGRAKISCIFSIDTAMTSFVPSFFFPLHSFFPTFNPHYLFSFSRCLPTFPIVISARNCRERKRKRDGSIQSDFKKLMIGIFMSRKEVMHTPRKLSLYICIYAHPIFPDYVGNVVPCICQTTRVNICVCMIGYRSTKIPLETGKCIKNVSKHKYIDFYLKKCCFRFPLYSFSTTNKLFLRLGRNYFAIRI